jgi:C-terminal domain of alpha-glycerophosphate oxidase
VVEQGVPIAAWLCSQHLQAVKQPTPTPPGRRSACSDNACIIAPRDNCLLCTAAQERARACRYEGCRTAEDFLARRSRLAFLDVAAARHALPRVLELLAREHRWSWLRGRVAKEKRQALAFLETFEAAPPEAALVASGDVVARDAGKGLAAVPPPV